MLRQHTGRPGTPVVPDNWADAPATIIAKTLMSNCSIRHPGTTSGAFNTTTGRRDGAAANPAHYAGPCRVDPVASPGGGERLQVVADEQVTQVRFAVVLPRDSAPATEVDDIVTVTGIGDMVVASMEEATQTFSRVLYCTEHL